MAATSNPYRRKQDAILGIDLSNQHSRPSSQATFGRSDTGKPLPSLPTPGTPKLTTCAVGGRSIRTVGAIPAQISQFQQIPEHRALTPDFERRANSSCENDAHDLADIRKEIESVYNGTDYHDPYTASPVSESHDRDPFDGDEEEEEEEEEDEEYDSLEDDMSMYAGSVMPRRRLHESKRMAELRGDHCSGRSTSALGFRSNSTDSSTALPSKAERMLGIVPKRAHSTALAPAPRVSKSKKGCLAPKAQRLLGVRADTIRKSSRFQQDKGTPDASLAPGGMTMGAGAEVEDFKRLLLGGRFRGSSRKANTESVSDASSMSRSSVMDSQTSRSSRELLSPDADSLTWTSPNSAPPPWLGVHPAFRKKPSIDSENLSPISPHTLLASSAPVTVPMYANFSSLNNTASAAPVELDAGPVGPPSPIELPVPAGDMINRSLPDEVYEMSSGPPSPKSDGPRTAGTRLGVQRSSSSLLMQAFSNRPSSADDAGSPTLGVPRKQERPSAIFDNPNIFEMAGDIPEVSAPVIIDGRQHRQLLNAFPSPPTPPPTGKSVPGKSSHLQFGISAPPPPQSPYAPPQRPLPTLPPPRATPDGSVQMTVDFDSGRTRQHSEDTLLSPRSADERSLRSQHSMQSLRSNPENAPPLTASSVPSPLAMALAEGNPITKEAPPPLRSAADYPPTAEQLAAQAEKRRVELSDKNARGPAKAARQKIIDDDNVSAHRPFSWQSTRTTRSMRIEEDAPPMPPPLALKIPSDAVRKAASHLGSATRSGAVTATPLTATSARSRASRLEKALGEALSKEGMDKALSGEKIEDLFRSAGAEELFLDCSKESRELIGLEPGEDTEEAQHAHTRAQELLKDLSDLQREVNQLRKLYAEGGPLEGLDLSQIGSSTI